MLLTSTPYLDTMVKEMITQAFVTYVYKEARNGIELDV